MKRCAQSSAIERHNGIARHRDASAQKRRVLAAANVASATRAILIRRRNAHPFTTAVLAMTRLLAFLFSTTLALSSLAQPYPTKPVKLVVGYPPGGSGDFL